MICPHGDKVFLHVWYCRENEVRFHEKNEAD
jgi:hypothetical protein